MIGIHVKTKRIQDLKASLKYAKNIGCSHIQIFNENIDSDFNMKKVLKKLDLKLVVHSPYTINIASQFEPHGWRTKHLLLEIENSITNGAIGLVVHMGRKMMLPLDVAYNNMYRLLELASTKLKGDFNIYLETTAGQGTELCYKLEDLAYFYNRIKMNKKMSHIKICLDTCHIFCAGYDIRTKKSVDTFIKKFDKLIGIENIGLIHMNDSINDLGTHKDRHANIGDGYIGVNGLRYFYQTFAKKNVPGILETPVENYETEIKLLKLIKD